METFKKRQKEMLRLEKQREKAARRLAKKRQPLLAEDTPLDENGDPIITPAEGTGEDAPEDGPAESRAHAAE